MTSEAPQLGVEVGDGHNYQLLVVNQMPLEHFDSHEYDRRTPEEWVAMGAEDGGTRALSKYFENGELVWAPCRVVTFDPVHVDQKSGDTSEQYEIVWQATNNRKWVKRLNLRFEGEDAQMFDRRVCEAQQRKIDKEAQSRLVRYVDEVPQAAVRPLNENRVGEILSSVSDEVPQDFVPMLEGCVEEMHHEYNRAVKYSTVKYQMMNQQERERLHSMELPAEISNPTVPHFGQVQLPPDALDFHACQAAIHTNLFQSHEAVALALQKIFVTYSAVEEHVFLEVGPTSEGNTDPVEVDEFRERQLKHNESVIQSLSIDWRGEVVHTVVNYLEELFDFNQYSYEAYRDTRLYRFLKFVACVMGQQLRELEENTLAKLIEYIDFVLDDPKAPGPVFNVKLVMIDDEPQFTPPLEEVMGSILGVFDDTFFWGTQMLRIDKEVFPIMELSDEPLPGATPSEPELQDMRKALAAKLQSAMEGAVQLKKTYLDKFEPLINTDVNKFRADGIQNFSNNEQCQAAIDEYKSFAGASMDWSGDVVDYALVRVNCSELKASISEKAHDLACATLDILVGLLKTKNEYVHSEYNVIFDRVHEQPTTPEELTELKNYVESRAEKFAELENLVEEVNQTLVIFQDSHFLVPDDVFEKCCASNEWPSKIHEEVKDGQMRLEEEKLQFIEKLRANQEKFVETLDKVEEDVKAFQTLDSLDKVADIYEQVQNIEEMLETLESQSELYQSHEELLGFPKTESPQIQELRETFQPYAKLWRSAGLFAEQQPQWMDGSFPDIDPEKL